MAISVNELRIGNLVYGVSDRIEKIIEIHYKGGLWTSIGTHVEQYQHVENVENISRIPLTEEWLMKFGLSKATDNEHYFLNHFGFCLVFDGQDWCLKPLINEAYVIAYTRYVHSLQNLFYAISNKELTITQP